MVQWLGQFAALVTFSPLVLNSDWHFPQATTEEEDAGCSPAPPIKPIWTTEHRLLAAGNGSGHANRAGNSDRQMAVFTDLLEPGMV